MGRTKQRNPHRSGCWSTGTNEIESNQHTLLKNFVTAEDGPLGSGGRPYFVEIDRSCWVINEQLDLSEVVLGNLTVRGIHTDLQVDEDFYRLTRFFLRFRVSNVDDAALERMKFGHWPVASTRDVSLELVENLLFEGSQTHSVILSGNFDGPADGITALVHLTSIKFLTVRPVRGQELSGEMMSLRLRVGILTAALDACGSLLENTRQVWKKSMINLMAWLRPEVTTSELRYGIPIQATLKADAAIDLENEESSFNQRLKFDIAGFYEAIRPEQSSSLPEGSIPDIIPTLRPYQRRAVYWMVQREKEDPEVRNRAMSSQLLSPFSVRVNVLDSSTHFFYNPFSGSLSRKPEFVSTIVSGGILSDEMGLGKTVEMLACILSHRRLEVHDQSMQEKESQKFNLKRLKRERIECICGAVSESYKFKGIWVQCDLCSAWQHANCVGYSPRGKKKMSTTEIQKQRKKTKVTFVNRDGEFICPTCSELLKSAEGAVETGATLIVCPLSILPQWQSEILRHTRSGSLKICVYDGVRDKSLTNATTVDVSELVSADVVLTTYDVLKEDLSHDSDRHEGDRRFLRFQKRYPVIPTILTRIFWWRLCLDEAQMVESNAAACTEMALRLSAVHRWCITGTPIQRNLNDLYGLLKFLKTSPFDVYRWWNDVIREPYEKGDEGAINYTHMFFKQIMWRSSKAHVAHELELPPQDENVLWLKFSAIEEHFYQRQHETCVSYAREVVDSLKDDKIKRRGAGHESLDASCDHFITHTEASKLLHSLLKLRQACCHPQVGSYGLRSLQQSPMTMEEILMVLVSKTKFEGEEALRKMVIALNALAGIAIIQEKFDQAVALYREALATTEEHSDDFRLDPLMNIHIHHNLSEILPLVGETIVLPSCSNEESCQDGLGITSVSYKVNVIDSDTVKRQKVVNENSSSIIDDKSSSISVGNYSVPLVRSEDDCHNSCKSWEDSSCRSTPVKSGDGSQNSFRSITCNMLNSTCQNLMQKYLSVFISKLATAQQDFKKMHLQVCNANNSEDVQSRAWWLDAFTFVEQNKDVSNELIRKIENAIAGTFHNSKLSRITGRFRTITTLKYHIQTRLDELHESREKLLKRLLEVDMTMENPKLEDIERIRNCKACQAIDNGPLCVHCEMEDLFQDYVARLFRLNKLGGEIITSAEEAIDLQKKNSELNRFYWNLSHPSKTPSLVGDSKEESRRRDVRDRVVVSKSPSELEVILGVIKIYCKPHIGKDGTAAANKQLHLLETMRREYASARSLAVAQAQLLRAHDEIKMATSRLHVKHDEDDKSIDALSLSEVEPANVLHSSDKFVALNMLLRIKGKLRYLKRLMLSKQKSASGSSCDPCPTMASLERQSDFQSNDLDESCPICHEKLGNQKMVFQCGHVTCCKCLVELAEHRAEGKSQHKWIMCPTCRQHTDFGNLAYADDRQDRSCNSSLPRLEGFEQIEENVVVNGSYGTKIEAIVRRILWIKSSDAKAKVLVFSSWKDVLDVLEHAFRSNDVKYVRMKGGKKSQDSLRVFRGETSMSSCRGKGQQTESVQVLLLLIQHGANGLNLLQAQHVILVEPLLNPAAEAQAISRVHRIGQQQRTTVHRFLVKGTVEESIFKLNRSRNTSVGSYKSGKARNEDKPFLTLKDVEYLFATVHASVPEHDNEDSDSLTHLPPPVAAAIAAERRLKRPRHES